ncbi:MAG TPA: glycosyltransferase family 87 protein, partial [Dongiaceae bacterium]|nr:glycosyltransferase family 87 protein [Dongiaceae bacterium]
MPAPPDLLHGLLEVAQFLQSRHRELGELVCVGVLPLIPLLLAGLHAGRNDVRVRRFALRAAVAVVLFYAGVYTAIIASNVVHPQDWDLVTYWLYGLVAAHGVNFYDPEHYRRLSDGIATSPEIVAFVVNVGFNLPPPSIFLVLPLGWFSLHTASVLWYVPLVATAAVDVTLLTRLFVGRSRAATLFVAALVLALRPAMATAWFGQTNFLVLLLLLLFWRDRDTLRAGVWFGLGMLVKPVFATLGLYVVIARRWRVAAGAAGVLAALSLVTIAVFGWETFATYFVNGPVTRTPFGAYTEEINQSLLAVILRATHAEPTPGSPVTHPLFVAVGLTLVAITTWRVHRAHHAGDDDLAVAL